MGDNTPVLLGDLGGTHLRLAWLENGTPKNPRLYTVHEWASLSDVLHDFQGAYAGARLILSFAKKYNPDGVYRLDQPHKGASWEFRVADLKQSHGFANVDVVHDFRAMAMALFYKGPAFLEIKHGVATNDLRLVMGVGTGLGHALVDPVSHAIYDTFGGHFLPCTVTSEQQDILTKLKNNFGEERSFVFEEILSGRGLQKLKEIVPESATRIFCEFLGLYTNTVCVAAHAFGGVYLTGGVLQKLFDAGAFDMQAFLKHVRLNMVPVVESSLDATPFYRAQDDATALYGLAVMAEQKP